MDTAKGTNTPNTSKDTPKETPKATAKAINAKEYAESKGYTAINKFVVSRKFPDNTVKKSPDDWKKIMDKLFTL